MKRTILLFICWLPNLILELLIFFQKNSKKINKYETNPGLIKLLEATLYKMIFWSCKQNKNIIRVCFTKKKEAISVFLLKYFMFNSTHYLPFVCNCLRNYLQFLSENVFTPFFQCSNFCVTNITKWNYSFPNTLSAIHWSDKRMDTPPNSPHWLSQRCCFGWLDLRLRLFLFVTYTIT